MTAEVQNAESASGARVTLRAPSSEQSSIDSLVIRLVRPHEHEEAGRVTADAYFASYDDPPSHTWTPLAIFDPTGHIAKGVQV